MKLERGDTVPITGRTANFVPVGMDSFKESELASEVADFKDQTLPGAAIMMVVTS